MCLLTVLSRLHPAGPLVVAANRDEFLTRPTEPFGVLEDGPPRLLGGRDARSGGTWLTVSERGLVVGLTNCPLPAGPDPSRRSRGELPLRLARAASAREAACEVAAGLRGEDYNPCWLLVGDREALFWLDLTRSGPPRTEELPPGIHVLENRPLDAASSKASQVRSRLEPLLEASAEELPEGLARVLASHERATPAKASMRPPELEAPCVHREGYGTRSAAVVLVPAGPARPRVLAAEGPPCRHPLEDRSGLWELPRAAV